MLKEEDEEDGASVQEPYRRNRPSEPQQQRHSYVGVPLALISMNSGACFIMRMGR